jgi:hypothetical protein
LESNEPINLGDRHGCYSCGRVLQQIDVGDKKCQSEPHGAKALEPEILHDSWYYPAPLPLVAASTVLQEKLPLVVNMFTGLRRLVAAKSALLDLVPCNSYIFG